MTASELYNPGEYMMRRCGSSWEYCRGNCSNCRRCNSTAVFSTNTIPNYNGYTVTSNTNPQGFPKYLVKERQNDI